MPWRFCFNFPRSSPEKVFVQRRICFDIPVLIRKFPDNDPGPWITKGYLDDKLVKDLPILATIDALASQLSNATIRKTVQRTIQGAVDQKSLPENTGVQFK